MTCHTIQGSWPSPVPAGCVLCFTHFALRGCQDIEPDTSELLLSRCPLSFALSQSQSPQRRGCPETGPRWVLTGPRSDQASRRGSSSFLTSTCYDLWTDSKKAPDLIRAGSPPLKAAFGSASVAWNGKSGVRLHAGRRKLRQRHCGGGGGGGDALIVMLQVQMALCFMCGLNGLCQPSYWRHIIWRDHTKTLSTKIQRFINKGHFHDSKCLLDGRGSGSRHERDKSLAGNWTSPPTKAEFHF